MLEEGEKGSVPVILLSPAGKSFSQVGARELAGEKKIIFVCGRYKGVDERVNQLVVTERISLGDYVLSGGELPALILIDAVTRLLPGVLGDPDAPQKDSHATGLLEHPHYTRPPEYRGWEVPEVLRSGNHAEIDKWRRQQALKRTAQRRPDMLEDADLSEEDQDFLAGDE